MASAEPWWVPALAVLEVRSIVGGATTKPSFQHGGEVRVRERPGATADVELGPATDDPDVRREPLVVGPGRRADGVLADELDLDVVTVPAVDDVDAEPAEQDVVTGPPSRTSFPSLPTSTSLPSPPLAVNWIAGRQGRGLHHVVAGERVDREAVGGALGTGDVHLGGEAERRDAGRIAGHDDDVVAVGALHDDVVDRSVAGAAEGSQVGVHLDHVGTTEIVDHDRVGTAQGRGRCPPRRRGP